MLGPSTGSLRCFRRCEDRAFGADLVFIMLSGVPMFVEAHCEPVLFEAALLDDRLPQRWKIYVCLEAKNRLHLARCRNGSLPGLLVD